MELTRRQAAVLDQIRADMLTRGYPPTVRELADLLNCGVGTIHRTLRQLEEGGRIERQPGSPRAIRII